MFYMYNNQVLAVGQQVTNSLKSLSLTACERCFKSCVPSLGRVYTISTQDERLSLRLWLLWLFVGRRSSCLLRLCHLQFEIGLALDHLREPAIDADDTVPFGAEICVCGTFVLPS